MTKEVSSKARTYYELSDITDMKDKLITLQVEMLNRLESARLQYNHVLPLDIAERIYSEMNDRIKILLKDYKETYIGYIRSKSQM
jgi:hypothetical protein